jgi:hypothetical protein
MIRWVHSAIRLEKSSDDTVCRRLCMLCQPSGAFVPVDDLILFKPHLAHTQGFRTAEKEFREKFFLTVSACTLAMPKTQRAAQGMALPVEPVLHHIIAVQGSAVHHGCTARKLPSLCRLRWRRSSSSAAALRTCSSRYVGGGSKSQRRLNYQTTPKKDGAKRSKARGRSLQNSPSLQPTLSSLIY